MSDSSIQQFRQEVAALTKSHPKWSAKKLAEDLGVTTARVRRALGWLQENKGNEVPKFNPSDPMVRSDTIKLLKRNKKNGITLDKLAQYLHTTEKMAKEVLSHLAHHDGYNIATHSGTYSLSDVLPPIKPLNVQALRGKPIKFGVVSDTHLCSHAQRLDVLEAAYDTFAQQGITQVFHAGNMIDGEFKFNRYELYAHGVHDQCSYMADHYPQRPGITTYFITGECFDDQTQVMTRRAGFILFKDLQPDDEIATLNMDTKEWEWQVPWEIIRKPYKGKMYRFKSQKVDFVVTPNHRMMYRKQGSPKDYEVCTAEEFSPICDKQFFQGCEWSQGTLPGTVTIPYVSTRNTWMVKNDTNEFPVVPFVQLLGWYIAEGSVEQEGTEIRIAQNPGDNRDEIISIVRRLGFEPRISDAEVVFCSIHLASYLRTLGHSHQKFIPSNIKEMNSVLLEEFLRAYWKGDGHGYGTDEAYASTSSERLASDLVEVAMKVGWAATFSIRDDVGKKKTINGVETQSNYPEHCVYLAKNKMPWFRGGPEEMEYDGEVFCANTFNSTLLVKRGSKVFWSANCHEGWWQKDCGLRIGWYIQNWAEERGRKDLVHIGHLEQDVLFERPHGTFRLRIIHPGGGTPYALSYPSQKMVESFQGGEKPQAMIMGHYHKFDMVYPREVLCLMPGCVQDQTPFMRKKRLGAHVGFCMCTIGARVDGTLGRFNVEWVPYYDRQYHQKFDGYDLTKEML